MLSLLFYKVIYTRRLKAGARKLQTVSRAWHYNYLLLLTERSNLLHKDQINHIQKLIIWYYRSWPGIEPVTSQTKSRDPDTEHSIIYLCGPRPLCHKKT